MKKKERKRETLKESSANTEKALRVFLQKEKERKMHIVASLRKQEKKRKQKGKRREKKRRRRRKKSPP